MSVVTKYMTVQVDELGKRRVWAVLKSGERWEGDILVGADGINSKVLAIFVHMLCYICGAMLSNSACYAVLH